VAEQGPDELFRRVGEVRELEFDDEYFEHMASRSHYEKHVVTVSEILEVHGGQAGYFENSGGGRAPIIMVGQTTAGRYICVPVEPTGRFGRWRVVTAFSANEHHRRRYEESSSGE
jgi:hypothetical protein